MRATRLVWRSNNFASGILWNKDEVLALVSISTSVSISGTASLVVAFNDTFVRDNKRVGASIFSARVSSASITVITNVVSHTLDVTFSSMSADSFSLARSSFAFLLADMRRNASFNVIESTQSSVGVTVDSLAILGDGDSALCSILDTINISSASLVVSAFWSVLYCVNAVSSLEVAVVAGAFVSI
jgi:hypothetical protein